MLHLGDSNNIRETLRHTHSNKWRQIEKSKRLSTREREKKSCEIERLPATAADLQFYRKRHLVRDSERVVARSHCNNENKLKRVHTTFLFTHREQVEVTALFDGTLCDLLLFVVVVVDCCWCYGVKLYDFSTRRWRCCDAALCCWCINDVVCRVPIDSER